MRVRRALAIALIGFGLHAAATDGHDIESSSAGFWQTTLVSSHEPAPGVRIMPLPGRVPGMFLETTGADPVVILGRSGEPFLRFSDRGVEANVRSPLWIDNAQARGEATTSAGDPNGAPDWRSVSATSRFAWIEFRAWPGTDEPKVSADHAPHRLAWSSPMRVGDRSLVLVGLTTWHPTAKTATSDRMQIVN